MTPAARLNAALEILQKIQDSRIPMDATVGDYMRFRRYIGSKDRAEIAERVYNMMRSRARIGWWLEKLNAEDTPRHRLIANLMLQHGCDLAKLQSLFNGEKFNPAPLDETEIELAKSLEGKELETNAMPDAVRVECPPQFEEALRKLYKDNFREEMTAMLSAAPLDLRVNYLALDRDSAQASLAKDNVLTDPTPYCPWTLRARSKAFLSDTKAFTKGHIEIQDEGSQLIAYICAAGPGAQVLDYCAGAGGKTLAIVNAMALNKKPKGRIVAMDIDAGRLEKARPRFRRAHAHDIIEVRPLSDEKTRKWLKRQKQTFDIVLTDVPCSGTGTWRRNPDMRWRNFGPTLEELKIIQAEILEKVAVAVKPGGRLVYATCSLLPEENEEQIEKFLSRHPEFSVLPVADAWPGETPAPDLGHPYMRLSSLRHNTDGFFAAILQREGTPETALPVDSEDEII
ncbi:MAG: RsmB/NOP family class I SAM-dependent RNA methyltransferase [Micavibrio sp.]